MFNDIQTFMAEAGESGCYTLCLIEVAERYNRDHNRDHNRESLDVVSAMRLGIEKKCIHYNENDKNDNDNFFVNLPATFLYYLTGIHWNVTKQNYPYIKDDDEFIINRWERVKTGAVIGHFDMDDFHPIANSLTVQYGKIVSVRVCKPV